MVTNTKKNIGSPYQMLQLCFYWSLHISLVQAEIKGAQKFFNILMDESTQTHIFPRRKRVLRCGDMYVCKFCSRTYFTRSGLWKHRCGKAKPFSDLKIQLARVSIAFDNVIRQARRTNIDSDILEDFKKSIEDANSIAAHTVSLIDKDS
jgi:hypothetical protein